MKTYLQNLFFLPALITALGLMPAVRVTAQIFIHEPLYPASSRNSSGVFTNSGGANPYAGLTQAGNGSIRYGTTSHGGSVGAGTIFAINTDGTSFTTLYSFTALPPWPEWTNSDGASPQAGLKLTNTTLYGTCLVAGSGGGGTVFDVSTDGRGFTLLHDFTADAELDGPFTNSDGVESVRSDCFYRATPLIGRQEVASVLE